MMDVHDIVDKSRPIRLLVVDDNPAAVYATSRVLRSAGYDIIEATTGAAALEAAPRADLVVLDVNLPDLDGFEVCRRLRANPQTARIPVLHLSATFTNSSDFVQGFEAGADGYLTRPVEAPVLLATVRTLLFARHADSLRRGLDARLRMVFDFVPVAIAMLDETLRIERANPAFGALTGYRVEELAGRFFDAARGITTDAAAPAPGRSGRLQLERKDEGVREVEWQMAEESTTGVRFLVVTDISEQSRATQARERLLESERAARTEAERSNRLKEEFLATLSHELRNPLNAILGWATILSRRSDLPEPVTQGLKAIERNSRLQATMISDLLDYAAISFGKVRLVIETIDPYPAVRAAIEAASGAAREAGVGIEPSFEEVSLRIRADGGRLQQVVWNLLTNAIKFSSRGGAVQLTVGRSGESFRLIVRDQGQGIEPEFLPRIFERFSQQDSTTTRSHGGLGLGMAIVKQLTDLHSGTIRAESAGKGLGATFTLELPLSRDEMVPGLSDSQTVRATDFSTVVALVVDDDTDARELTRRILTDVGAAVVEASSADDAVERIGTCQANILISDIGMAREDGYQLLRRLREMGHGPDALPAIALTAFARAEDRHTALAAGFQEHIVKPLDAVTLLARVASLAPKGAPTAG